MTAAALRTGELIAEEMSGGAFTATARAS
jgi:hypothetical protein